MTKNLSLKLKSGGLWSRLAFLLVIMLMTGMQAMARIVSVVSAQGMAEAIYNTLYASGDTIKMLGNISLSHSVPELEVYGGRNFTLDLNGKTLTAYESNAITIYHGSALTLIDSGTTGSITKSGVYIKSGATFTMTDGSITNCTIGAYGGVFNQGTFIMTGGSIYGNHESIVGGVTSTGTFIMTGGSITDNYGTLSGGVRVSGTVILGGKAVIKDNTVGNDISMNLLLDNTTVTISSDNPFEEGAEIWFTICTEEKEIVYCIEEPGEVYDVTNNGANTDMQYFHGYNEDEECGGMLIYETNDADTYVIRYTIPTAQIGENDDAVIYSSVQKAVDMASDYETVKMINNCNRNVNVSGKTLTLDLNGFVLNGTGSGSVVTVESDANLTINDSGSSAEHSYVVQDNGVWQWDDEATDATETYESLTECPSTDDVIVVNGGAITGGVGETRGGGICNCGTLTLNNGSVIGNRTSNDDNYGGGVAVYGNGVFTINGGKIAGNKSASGGGVSVESGAFTMTGGSVSYNTSADGGVYANEYVTLGGSANITGNIGGNLYLTNGKTVAISAPVNNMSVGVTTQTAPTVTTPVVVTNDSGAGCDRYFTSDAGYLVENDGNIVMLGMITHVYVSADGDDSTGDGTVENPYKTIPKAVDALGGNYGKIHVMNDIVQPSFTTTFSGSVIIASDDGDPTTTDDMFTVYAGDADGFIGCFNGGIIKLQNIIVDGRVGGAGSATKASGAFKVENNATLRLRSGLTVRNFNVAANTSDGGSAIFEAQSNSTLIIEDEMLITENIVNQGKSEYPTNANAVIMIGSNSVLDMRGGAITGNTSTGAATSMVNLGIDAIAYISGGGIYGNTMYNDGSYACYKCMQDATTAINSSYYFSGSARIFDNLDTDSRQKNVHRPDGTNIIIKGALADNAKIGVSSVETPTAGDVVAEGADYDLANTDASVLFDDRQTLSIIRHNTNNQLVFGDVAVSTTLLLNTLTTTTLTGTFGDPIGATSNDISVFKNGVRMTSGYTVAVSGTALTINFNPAMYGNLTVGVGVYRNGYKVNDGAIVYKHVHIHCICGDGTCTAGGHSHQDIEWEVWTSTAELPTQGGNWYLNNDVTLTSTYTPVNGVNLCLNGHVIRQTNDGQRVITVNGGKNFTLTDCDNAATHNFMVASNGLWTLTNDVKTIDYESLAECPPTGAVIAVKGGVITGGNTSTGSSFGGAGVLSLGDFTMYNGNIIGNYDSWGGGGVSVSTTDPSLNPTFNMKGGNIAGNASGGYGGGIYISQFKSKFTLEGGKIAANTSAGIYADGTMTVGGTAVVDNNVNADKSNECNIYLPDVTVSVSTYTPLTEGANIGITTATAPTAGNPVAITTTNSAGYSAYFTSDNAACRAADRGTGSEQVVKLFYVETLSGALADRSEKTYDGEYTIAAAKDGGAWVDNGITAELTGNIVNEASQLTIHEGGQLITDNTTNATVEKNITAAPNWSSDETAEGWYTIASPVRGITTADVTNMITTGEGEDYDLFRYYEPSYRWVNSKDANDHWDNIQAGRGYLYAAETTRTLGFAGELNSGNPTYNLTSSSDNLTGFNLLGNPYTQNITLANITLSDDATFAGSGYYILSNTGTWSAKLTDEIAPCTGFLVQVDKATTATFSKTADSSKDSAKHASIAIRVANNEFEDMAYALFTDGDGLGKISHRTADAPMLYITQNGTHYSIATMSENTTVFPLSFKAATTGYCTISLKSSQIHEGCNDFDYLHLIDNMTGNDIDMQLEDEYRFIGSPADNADRFTVVLHRYSVDENVDEDENVVYQNGNELVINGEGTLQIFDMLGRVVINEELKGGRISTSDFTTGTYIVRIIGNDIKNQKIIIR